jgi:internalin A
MSKDLEIIRQLEKQLKIKLNQLEEINFAQIGYVVDEQGNVTGLSLYGVGINDISAIKRLTNLNDLYLYSNLITDISAVMNLTNLSKLYLGSNKITDIYTVKGLTNLTALNLGRNKISDISAIKGLTNLTKLDLSYNQITDISAVKSLKNLTELNLDSNQVTDISTVKGLTNLTKLDLSYNKIKKLPAELIGLKMEIVWEFGWIEKGLNLYGNPLEIPPVEFVEQGKQAIREYFKSLKEGKRLLNEVKVLLVGDGGAGKTSLVKRIIYDKFDFNEKQTHGVYRDDWQIQTEGKKITIHFWDFGGQGIMQSAHQLFFSIRSLYILVMNARQEPDPEDWFKRIESFGGDSPIMVVINKIDGNPYSLNEKDLQRKYPSIKGFYHVSCSEKIGLEDFKKALIKQIAQVEMIKTELPISWFNVKKRLESLRGENYITLDRYEDICQEEKVTESNARKTLIDYLHILGVALHYEDFELLDKQVLNPEWITKAIYKIINSKKLREEQGILSKSLLSYILNEEVLPDFAGNGEKYSHQEEQYIVDVMKKFELCFELDIHGKADYILVPDLLKANEADYQFLEKDNIRFYFEYDFLPSSVFPSFMVRMQKDIDSELCWRTGLIMQDKNFDARALVQLDKNKRRVNIHVAGKQKRDYFSTIRKTLLDINSSFLKLDVKEWVPLPDEKDFAIEHDELRGYQDANRDKIFIGKLRKEYSVSKLLDGIERPEERETRRDKSTGSIKIEHINIHSKHTTFADEIGKIETHDR